MKNLALLLFFISTALFSQKNTAGFFVSPDYAYRAKQNSSAYFDILEAPKFGYTVGLTYERNICKNFAITTGLGFSNKGYRAKPSKLSFSNQIVEKRGFVMPRFVGPNYYTEYINRESIFLLSVPVGFTYNIQVKKFTFFINAGASANYTLAAKSIYFTSPRPGEKEKRIANDKEFFEDISFSFNASIGVEKEIAGYKFRLFPNFNYCINNIYTYDQYNDDKLYPYSIGLGLGAYKSF